MQELGGKPTPSGITMQELGVRWHRLGITMGGLGGESIAESYADQRLGLTQAVEQERTLKPIRLMLMMRMTQRIY